MTHKLVFTLNMKGFAEVKESRGTPDAPFREIPFEVGRYRSVM
jgi:hypothetical protein